MKLVTAIIKPFMLDPVREALNLVGVGGVTVTEVKGFGRQKGHAEFRLGAGQEAYFIPKLMLEVVVDDSAALVTVETIKSAAFTGKVGDGKIFVVDLQSATRIRTGETGSAAI